MDSLEGVVATEYYAGQEAHSLVEAHGALQVASASRQTSSLWDAFADVFLPAGFPNSVSEDYVKYQVWDTAQALCSYITGSLATQAVMKGFGVGDTTATAAGAAVTWMLRDGTGMLGRLVFTWYNAIDFDSNSKQWRLLADVLNDLAIFVELLAPSFPSLFLLLLCFATVARSVVGVAGGATRAALTQHQARSNNTGDVSAKDGSQETVINLLGLMLSIALAPLVADNPTLLWSLFVTFTVTHLFCNYRAVKALVFRQFNARRARLCLDQYLSEGTVPDCRWAAAQEDLNPVSLESRALRLGVSAQVFTSAECLRRAVREQPDGASRGYLLAVAPPSARVAVVLRPDVDDLLVFEAFFHAYLARKVLQGAALPPQYAAFVAAQEPADVGPGGAVEATAAFARIHFPLVLAASRAAGWDLDTFLLGTGQWRVDWLRELKTR